jgi:uncharacterized membrane protein
VFGELEFFVREAVRRMMDSQVTKVLGKVVIIVWLCGCVCGLSRWSLTRLHAFHIIVLVYLQTVYGVPPSRQASRLQRGRTP